MQHAICNTFSRRQSQSSAHRNSREVEFFEMSDSSADSEGAALDEIIITPSSFDMGLYDLQSSPIHVCDPSRSGDGDIVPGSATTATTSAAHSPHSSHNQHSPSLSSTSQQYLHHSHLGAHSHHHFHFDQPTNAAEKSNEASSSCTSSNQLTTDSCNAINGIAKKNSTSRRKEYSMRGQKSAGAKNLSQDSAFGSMTDGEPSIASSSFRLSSFQSISSPIDEGVEDIGSSLLDLVASSSDSASNKETSAMEPRTDGHIARSTSDSAALQKGSMEAGTSGASVAVLTTNHQQQQHQQQQHLLPLEPPKIIVNNGDQQNGGGTFYTTSPSKQCHNVVGGTIEVFSQKYRVSSFEDMSLRRTPLKSVNKLAFRSLEEERRIESAFLPTTNMLSSSPSLQHQHHLAQPQPPATPQPPQAFKQRCVSASPAIPSAEMLDPNSSPSPAGGPTAQMRVYNNEKFKKLTHAAFSRKITSTKEHHTKWKNSILARKNVLIRSNESLLMEQPQNDGCDQSYGGGADTKWRPQHQQQQQHPFPAPTLAMPISQSMSMRGMQKRIGSTNELCSRQLAVDSAAGGGRLELDFEHKGPRKSRSERQLWSLYGGGVKQRSLNGDYDAVACSAAGGSRSGGTGFGAHRSDIVTYIDDSASSEGSTFEEFDDDDENDENEHSSSSNSHRDMCQIIGGFVEANERSSAASVVGSTSGDENRPLLDEMEMSPISPVECSEML